MAILVDDSYLRVCANVLQQKLEKKVVVVPPSYMERVKSKDFISVNSAALLVIRAVRDLCRSSIGSTVSPETLRASHSLLSRAYKLTTDFKEKRTIAKTLSTIFDFLVMKKPSYVLELFQEKDIQTISSTELRRVETLLHSLYNDREIFIKLLTHDALEFIKINLLKFFESGGGVFKQSKEREFAAFDWERMKIQTPEGIAISARLERALFQGDLMEELTSLLRRKGFVDGDTQHILELWQLYSLINVIGNFQYMVACSLRTSELTSYKVTDPIVSQAYMLAFQKRCDFRYNIMLNHFTDYSSVFSYKDVLDFFVAHVENLMRLVADYSPNSLHINSLYSSAYMKYHETIPYQKGFIFRRPEPPLGFKSLSIPTLDCSGIQERLFSVSLFRIYAAKGHKGLCESLAAIISPDNADFCSYLLDFFHIVRQKKQQEPPLIFEHVAISPAPSIGPSKKKSPKFNPQKHFAHRKIRHSHKKSAASSHDLKFLPNDLKVLHLGEEKDFDQKTLASPACVESLPSDQEALQLCEDDDFDQKKDAQSQEGETSRELVQKIRCLSLSSETFVGEAPLLKEACLDPPAPLRYFLAPPIYKIHSRVRAWKNLMPSSENEDSIDFHRYPFFITRLILAYLPQEPWISPTTGKINRHFSCVGVIHRFGKNLAPVTGYFAECFDEYLLYHHFFHPAPPHVLLNRFRIANTFFSPADDQDLAEAQEGESLEETLDTQFQVSVGPFSLEVTDTKMQVRYKLAYTDK